MIIPNVITRIWTVGSAPEVENIRGNAFTEEAGAHTFVISGQSADKQAIELSGSVLAKVIRADNLTMDVEGTITDGVASVTLVGDCYNVPGRISIVIYLSDGTNTKAIYAAVINVYRGTSGQELDSGTTVPSLQQLEAAYNNCVSATQAAMDLISKIVTVEPENWLDLDGLEDGVLQSDGNIKEPVSTSTKHTDYVPVNTGNIIKLYRSNASPMTALTCNRICLYDANKNVVSGGLDSPYTSFTVPSGVAYVRISFAVSYIEQYVPMLVRNGGTVPAAYSAYFDPYTAYTEDFLTPASKAAVESVKENFSGALTDIAGLKTDVEGLDTAVSGINDALKPSLAEYAHNVKGFMREDGTISTLTSGGFRKYKLPSSVTKLYLNGDVSGWTIAENRYCYAWFVAGGAMMQGGALPVTQTHMVWDNAEVTVLTGAEEIWVYKSIVVNTSLTYDPKLENRIAKIEGNSGFDGQYTLSRMAFAMRMLADANGLYYIPFVAIGMGNTRGNGSQGNAYYRNGTDGIHPSDLGGYNIASAVWSYLKNIPLWHTSLPTSGTVEKFDGSQWSGKTWYAYGTSLTTQTNGKYAETVAGWANMTLTNKGYSGGGVVSDTHIFDRLCDLTDGKLGADLITIEVGANDLSAPLGDPWTMDTKTICGALNYCLKTMFDGGVNAQVVLMLSYRGRYRTSDPTYKYGLDYLYGG